MYLKYLFAEINLNFLFLVIIKNFFVRYIKVIKIYKRTILKLKYSPHIIPIIYPITIIITGLLIVSPPINYSIFICNKIDNYKILLAPT